MDECEKSALLCPKTSESARNFCIGSSSIDFELGFRLSYLSHDVFNKHMSD